jgi:hypothetical protein
VQQTHILINEFLAGLEQLQRLDASLSTQQDFNHDPLERKLRNIVEQLQMCRKKLQHASLPSVKNVPAPADSQ